MAQILVRNLDEEVVRKLKERAKLQGRSLQSEVRMILQGAAGREMMTMEEARRFSEKIAARLGKKKFPDSAELIREDRDR